MLRDDEEQPAYPAEQPEPMPEPPAGGGGGGLPEEEEEGGWGEFPEFGFSPGRGGWIG